MDNETLWAECVDAAAALTAAGSSLTSWGLPLVKGSGDWWLTDTDSTTVQATITTANVQNVADSVTWSTLATGIQFSGRHGCSGGNRASTVQDVISSTRQQRDRRYFRKSAYVAFFVNATPPTIIATTSGGRKLTNVGFSFGGNSATETTFYSRTAAARRHTLGRS